MKKRQIPIDQSASFPVPPGRFWAKLHPREQPIDWHPLIAHSADVAAVMQRLLSPGAALSQRLGRSLGQDQLSEVQRRALVFLAALHDIGKAGHGFQTKALREAEKRRYASAHRGHVQTLLSSLGFPPLRALVTEEVLASVSIDPRQAQEVFFATIAHHGRPWLPHTDPTSDVLWKPDASGRDPLTEIRRLVAHARRWSGLHAADGEPFPRPTPAFTHLYAGTLTLADWIGSTQSAFDFAPWADQEPDRYWETAQRLAAVACARIGTVPASVPCSGEGPPLLRSLFPMFSEEATPTNLQSHAAAMPLPPTGARLLIESETGSGKTEAALTLFARLRAAGHVDGLMFALPTRATSSAMFERVERALNTMYPEGPRPTLALAVGGQQPRTWSSEGWVGEPPETWPDEASRKAWELERWSTSSNKKFFAAEIVVGTLDQVLLGGLPLNHAHLRLAALSRHFLVVDELHSYDRYMAEILARILDLHTGWGGTALFMSATLSDVDRRRYGGGPERSYAEASALPYPTLSICTNRDAGWQDEHLPTLAPPKQVHWNVVEEVAVAAEVIAAARAGARVCVIANTVRRAREMVKTLLDEGADDLLWRPKGRGTDHTPAYHSRYTLPDRLVLDDQVRERFGKPAAGVRGGIVLVSTQVVEQSLDVDFDLLITDLCPIDVLLQRIGRLHRHRERDRHRPEAYSTPRVLVVGPENGGFEKHLKRKSLPIGWGEDRPYGNFLDGELTLRVIAGRPTIEIPRDNRLLVEAVYSAEMQQPFVVDPVWSEYLDKVTGKQISTDTHARSAALDFRRTYSDCASGFNNAREQHVRTRLGDASVRIELDHEVRCWYANAEEPVREIDLPAWALPGDSAFTLPDEPVRAVSDEGGTSFRLGARHYRYAPGGWEWVDE